MSDEDGDDVGEDDDHLDIDVGELVCKGDDDKVFARWKLLWLQEVILTKGGMVHLHDDDDYDNSGDDDEDMMMMNMTMMRCAPYKGQGQTLWPLSLGWQQPGKPS